jgi:hypothetical protein
MYAADVYKLGECQPPPAPVDALSEQQQRMLFGSARNSTQVAKELGITLPALRNHLPGIVTKGLLFGAPSGFTLEACGPQETGEKDIR